MGKVRPMNQTSEPEEPRGGEDAHPPRREGGCPAEGQDSGNQAEGAQSPQETTAVPRPGVPMSAEEWRAAKKAAERPDPEPEK
jgi:hypothetical protein